MLIKPCIAAIVVLFFVSPAISQREANVWYFGNHAGFDFNNGDPIPLDNGALETRGVSAVANHPKTGALLFYTDAENVWDREHRIMPNGTDLLGGGATQSALIVPVPGADGSFYLFTLCRDASSFHANLYYHVIDMELNNGLGDVAETRKNRFLLTNLTGKLTAVPHSNGRDFWLITHEYGTDVFYISLINEDGLSSFNAQAIGPRHYPVDSSNRDVWDFFDFGRGYLKFSPDGKRLASAINATRFDQGLNLFDFDAESGLISNYRSLDIEGGRSFGLSFSSDNTKLYVSTSTSGDVLLDAIVQYDLGYETVEEINNSRMGLFTGNPFDNIDFDGQRGGSANFALQLGPDGRIYSGDSWVAGLREKNHDLVVINQPNEKGFDASPRLVRFAFNKAEAGPLLPNFIESTFNGLSPRDNPNVPCEVFDNFSIFPNPTNRLIQVDVAEECFSPYRLEIYNAQGIMMNKAIVTNPMSDEIDLGRLADGLYLIILEPLPPNDGPRFPRRVIQKIIKV